MVARTAGTECYAWPQQHGTAGQQLTSGKRLACALRLAGEGRRVRCCMPAAAATPTAASGTMALTRLAVKPGRPRRTAAEAGAASGRGWLITESARESAEEPVEGVRGRAPVRRGVCMTERGEPGCSALGAAGLTGLAAAGLGAGAGWA